MGCSPTYALPFSLKYFASTMRNGFCCPGGIASGVFEMKRTVYASGVSTRSMSRMYGVCLELLAGFLIQSTENRTSALVNGSPFENTTWCRSLYSSVVGLMRLHERGGSGMSSP